MAIVLNVALYLLTNASDEAAHEVAVILPFGAALAARVLVQAVSGAAANDQAAASERTVSPGQAGQPRRRDRDPGRLYRRARIRDQPADGPPANASLAPWLLDHHLTYGLSGYWTSSSVTVDSGGRVQIRALLQYSLKRDLWMSNVVWYDPKLHYANFIVLDSRPGFMNHWEPRALIRKYFGRPARIYHTGPYTVLVWNRNLLNSIPR